MNTDIKKEERINFISISSIELLEYISWKLEFPKEAEMAFVEFCSRFEKGIIKKAVIYASKFNYNETIALELAHCTFNRVWKYAHSFNLESSKSKNPEKAIVKWMLRILWTQLVILKDKPSCIEPGEEEDLSIIKNVEDLVEFISLDNIEARRELRLRLEILEAAFEGLSEKHKIIYLTYKAYQQQGKYIPRSVSKKLEEKLLLTKSSIRVYKKNATEHIENYLKQLNGN